jgi:hypothetical protein
MNKPWVSIVTVSHSAKSASYLMKLMDTLDQQTFRDFELIVVDNEGSDALKRWLELRRDIYATRYVRNMSKYKGYPGGISAGVKESQGQLLLILNPDTRLEHTFLATMVREFNRQPADVMVLVPKVMIRDSNVINSIGMKRIRPNENIYTNIGWMERDVGQFDQPMLVKAFDGAAFMIKRELLTYTYVFDPRFFFGHDSTDLAERVDKLGFRMITCPSAVVKHEVRSTVAEASNNLLNVLLVRNLLIHTLHNRGRAAFVYTLVVGIMLRHLILPAVIRHRNVPGPMIYALGVARFFFDIGRFPKLTK